MYNLINYNSEKNITKIVLSELPSVMRNSVEIARGCRRTHEALLWNHELLQVTCVACKSLYSRGIKICISVIGMLLS